MDTSVDSLWARITQLENLVSQTRHDVHSALTPARLAGDFVRANSQPRAQRSGEVVVEAIDRTLKLLKTTRDVVPPKATPQRGS